MPMSDTATILQDFILENYLPGESRANLREDTPLRTSGILDSIATLNLINFIEQEFGIQVEAHETGIENFDRIRDIVAFINRKRAASV
jgi:acyl carrier protein